MKSLLKLAMGAAIAGAVISLLARQWSRMRPEDAVLASSAEKAGHGSEGFTIGELVTAASNADVSANR